MRTGNRESGDSGESDGKKKIPVVNSSSQFSILGLQARQFTAISQSRTHPYVARRMLLIPTSSPQSQSLSPTFFQVSFPFFFSQPTFPEHSQGLSFKGPVISTSKSPHISLYKENYLPSENQTKTFSYLVIIITINNNINNIYSFLKHLFTLTL